MILNPIVVKQGGGSQTIKHFVIVDEFEWDEQVRLSVTDYTAGESVRIVTELANAQFAAIAHDADGNDFPVEISRDTYYRGTISFVMPEKSLYITAKGEGPA
uniref:Uncharacterized protein n=1 Tax=Dulem virus 33 TaxID=3145751 RepID=A0AAU8B5G6_9CAUD